MTIFAHFDHGSPFVSAINFRKAILKCSADYQWVAAYRLRSNDLEKNKVCELVLATF